MGVPGLPMHRPVHFAHLLLNALPEHAAYETPFNPALPASAKEEWQDNRQKLH